MSTMGHKRTPTSRSGVSALPLKAEMFSVATDVHDILLLTPRGLAESRRVSRLTQSGGIAWNRVNSAWFHIQGMNVMSKEYARIAYSIRSEERRVGKTKK